MIEIRREDFSVDEAVRKMKNPKVGVVLTYVGTVREFPEGLGLEFESSSNARRRLEEIREITMGEFNIEDVAIIHRTGFLRLSENILLVAISASHREAAFDACKQIIDQIKVLHESWTKEVRR
ncbi:MAG: molybdenum cofactor biosynthesis protein MoaE [Dehalococcoidia bacterium]|nr:MAG: molybdenum cofactor biosynthesis protein MoaE [Dehalococcoidia bacterium]